MAFLPTDQVCGNQSFHMIAKSGERSQQGLKVAPTGTIWSFPSIHCPGDLIEVSANGTDLGDAALEGSKFGAGQWRKIS